MSGFVRPVRDVAMVDEDQASASGYGSGRSSTASTTAKSAVLAPMPSVEGEHGRGRKRRLAPEDPQRVSNVTSDHGEPILSMRCGAGCAGRARSRTASSTARRRHFSEQPRDGRGVADPQCADADDAAGRRMRRCCSARDPRAPARNSVAPRQTSGSHGTPRRASEAAHASDHRTRAGRACRRPRRTPARASRVARPRGVMR